MVFAMVACQGWEGGCILRIREALSEVVRSAGRDLQIKGHKTDLTFRNPDVKRLMARRFRDTAFKLHRELFCQWSGIVGRKQGNGQPVSYPIDSSLPLDVEIALTQLGSVFGQQMRFWGWDEDNDDRAAGEDRELPLTFVISDHDLAALKLCLAEFDEAISRHPAPKVTPQPCAHEVESPAAPLPLAEAEADIAAPSILGIPETFSTTSLQSIPRPQVASSVLILGLEGEGYFLGGLRKQPLTHGQYKVVCALIDAREAGLTGQNLVNNSIPSAIKALKNLAAKDPDWKAVIFLPGKPHGGYRLLCTEMSRKVQGGTERYRNFRQNV